MPTASSSHDAARVTTNGLGIHCLRLVSFLRCRILHLAKWPNLASTQLLYACKTWLAEAWAVLIYPKYTLGLRHI